MCTTFVNAKPEKSVKGGYLKNIAIVFFQVAQLSKSFINRIGYRSGYSVLCRYVCIQKERGRNRIDFLIKHLHM